MAQVIWTNVYRHDLFIHQGKPGEKGASGEPGQDGQKVSETSRTFSDILKALRYYFIHLFTG